MHTTCFCSSIVTASDIRMGEKCSSYGKASAHGVMGRVTGSIPHGGPIDLFLVPASVS